MPMTEARTQGLDLSDSAAGSAAAAIGAVWLLVWACLLVGMGAATWIADPENVTSARLVKMALFAVASFAGSIACFRKFHQFAQQDARSMRARDDEDWGTLVQAKILKRREKSLQNPRYLGGSESTAQAAVAVGAYLILTGPWSMTIEYEVNGHRVVDHGKVSSQVYYRYAKADTMPIRVNPLVPTEWTPVLDRQLVPATQLAAAPVTHPG